nr:NAD/NADP octopine/nopaline dehydrogenase family protein [Neorhizobium sp. SHOUNA12B]
MEDRNKDYGTTFATMRDYSLAPTPHNVQTLAPKDMDSRLYREEFIILTLWAAIARIADMPVPAIDAFLWITSAAYEEELPTFGRDLPGFNREDLISFGAKLN